MIRPELKPVEKEAEVTLKFPEVEAIAPPAIQLDEVSFSYATGRQILNKVNLSASSESRICIVSHSFHQLIVLLIYYCCGFNWN